MNYQQRLEKLITIEIRSSALLKQRRKIQKEVSEALQQGFSEIFKEWPFRGMISDLSVELNLVLRAGVRRIKNIKIPAIFYYRESELAISRKYGLKLPRSWRTYYPLLSYFEGEVKFKNNVFLVEDSGFSSPDVKPHTKIDFGALYGISSMSRKHLDKFLECFPRALRLRNMCLTLDPRNFRYSMETPFSLVENFSQFSHWTKLDEIIKKLPELRKAYRGWLHDRDQFLTEARRLKAELEEFNKPFKILLKLQGR